MRTHQKVSLPFTYLLVSCPCVIRWNVVGKWTVCLYTLHFNTRGVSGIWCQPGQSSTEVILILNRDAGMESELEISMANLAVRASLFDILGNCVVSVEPLMGSTHTVQKEHRFSTTFQAGKWWSLQRHCSGHIDCFKTLTFLFPQCLSMCHGDVCVLYNNKYKSNFSNKRSEHHLKS